MLQKYKPTKTYIYSWWIPDYNQHTSVDEVGEEEVDFVWRFSAFNANSQLKLIQSIIFP